VITLQPNPSAPPHKNPVHRRPPHLLQGVVFAEHCCLHDLRPPQSERACLVKDDGINVITTLKGIPT